MWIGSPGALVALPDPDPGVEMPAQRRSATHDLAAGGRVVDFLGPARLTISGAWSRLTEDEYATLEDFHNGGRGPGPFLLLPDVRWNYLSTAQAAATSMTLDTAGWSVPVGQSLAPAATPVYRGPRSLAWSLPASPPSARLTAIAPYGFTGWPAPPGVAWSWSLRARSSTASAYRTYMQLHYYDSAGAFITANSLENFISVGSWTLASITATPPAGTVYVSPQFVVDGTVAPAFTIHIDTPQLEMAPAPTGWLPGRGVPRVAFTDLSGSYPWADTRNTTATFTEVG